jgi:hypothetical protein
MLQVKGAQLFELRNAAHTSMNEGTPKHPGTEAIWDEVLSRGLRIWGTGTDDCHSHKPPFNPFKDPPCSAWTVVQAEELSVKAIVNALKAGHFYASTRLELKSLEISRQGIAMKIDPWNTMHYYTHFIGKGGKLLAEVDGPEPSYSFKGNEGYVRARLMCSDKHMAWTQPVFLD